jgi:monovalent cation:H+ antiporter-2, CPA2 family
VASVCAECVVLGDGWIHLRLCLTCGHVGCCENFKNTHAAAHYAASGHPVVQSYEPGEHWAWCHVDRMYPVRPA